jgi:hypothetical protein
MSETTLRAFFASPFADSGRLRAAADRQDVMRH